MTSLQLITCRRSANIMSGKSDAVLLEMSNQNQKSSSDYREEPNFGLSALSLVDSLCHGIAISLVVYLWWDCMQVYKLLSWHGPLFTMAYMFFMTEGFLIFLPHNTLTRDWRRKHLVKLHWILQLAGFICIVLGMIIIVVYKLLNNKRHFAKPHSITGLVAVILAVIVSLFGWWTRLDRKYHYGFKLSHLKLAHVSLGVAAQVLGYFSNYYKKMHDFEWRLFMSGVTIILGAVTFLFALRNLYFRLKNLLSK